MTNENTIITGKSKGLPIIIKLILLTPAALAFINAVSWVDDPEPYMGFAICLIVALAIMKIFKGGEIVVTDKRVYATVGSKKRVDLPLDSISAVGIGAWKKMAISTPSGKIVFIGVSNNKEIHESICNLLIERQTNKNYNV